MTDKTKKNKKVCLYNIDQIIQLTNELKDRGETIESISFKDEDDNFKFQNNRLFVFGYWNHISSIKVEIQEGNKLIHRTYEPELSFYSLDDLRITFETVRYIY